MAIVFLAACGMVALVGWLFWQTAPASRAPDPVPPPRRQRFELRQSAFASATIDLEPAAHAVLEDLAEAAHSRGMRLSFAVQPGLTVRCDPAALHEALHDLVAGALSHTGATRALLSARSHGGRIEITVADDGVGPAVETQTSLLRPAEQLLALHGATMEIDVRAEQGSIVTLRLPEPPANPVAAPRPVAAPAAAQQAATRNAGYVSAATV